MRDSQRIAINAFALDLEQVYTRVFDREHPEFAGAISQGGRLALGQIAGSDMRYHNVEHTMLVVTAGQLILIGKDRSDGGVSPSDWLHVVLALLCHDIGYVRGVCRLDGHHRFATGEGDDTVSLPEGCTDAALAPYHVSRSQQFVYEHFGTSVAPECDPARIASYIEMTRFPPPNTPKYRPTGTYAGLVRAADLIGQFGDPDYLHKLPALFDEFEQVGTNEAMDYKTPDDMLTGYTTFFREIVSPYIQDGMRYLSVTPEGAEWVATVQRHVREAAHGVA